MDLRIVAATNPDLRRLIEEKRFREDLFYRLNVVGLVVPPLRDRMEDLPLLVTSILRSVTERLGKSVAGLDRAAFAAMAAYPWPGNIRELENEIERAGAT